MSQSKKTVNKKRQQPQRMESKKNHGSIKPLIIGNVVIVVIAFIAFSPCLTGDLLSWDDYNYIRDNALIRTLSWDNILHIFNYKTIVVGNYHPLTILSYVVEYQLAGLNPFLYHFDNLILHLFNILLFSRLMWLLTKKNLATLIATALFAIHPMRVESVVWAAERKDVLYTCFFLLSLIFYVWFVLKEHGNKKYYLISIAFFILSILSKGQAVVLPLVLFLVDYWYSKKITLIRILDKLPYLFLSLLSGVLALVAQHSSLTEQRLMVYSFLDRLAIAGFNITAYLFKLIYPFNLSCFYKYPSADDMFWVYAGAFFAIALIVAAAVFFRKNRTVVFGSLFFLFTISIVSQFLPVGNAIIADRYTYIPYIGLFFISGIMLDQAITATGKNKPYLLVWLVILGIIFMTKTYSQSMTWHDNLSLWQNAIRHDPENGVAYTNLGKYYIDKKEYQTSIDLLKKAIQNEAAYSGSDQAYENLGGAYAKTGQYDQAIKSYSTALSLRPTFVDAFFGRGLAYTSVGKNDSAVADFSTIITKLYPLHTRAYYSRGIAYNKLNQPDSAIADYTDAIRIDPGYGEAYINRGNIYYTRNQFNDAMADYNHAIGIMPNEGRIYLNRSFVCFKLARYREALEDALKAKDLNTKVHPDYIRDLKAAVKSP